MALKVGQAEENVGVHDGPADFGGRHILAAGHRNLHIVGALKSVSYYNVAPGGEGGKAVFIGCLQMLQGILAPPHIEGVAVGEEGLAAQTGHQVGYRLGVVGAQIGEVARLAEMDLDGGKFLLKINLLNAGRLHQAGQLLGQAAAHRNPEVGKIYLTGSHGVLLHKAMRNIG
ncbi:hypothetical protein SDC9_95271 [bioreactor metagenome]|uniref:Uncharacterized protein n=1 Tax=bioreactor metagenome TaxID=1076179 RepID=A0A645A6H6_9ZZZZ